MFSFFKKKLSLTGERGKFIFVRNENFVTLSRPSLTSSMVTGNFSVVRVRYYLASSFTFASQQRLTANNVQLPPLTCSNSDNNMLMSSSKKRAATTLGPVLLCEQVK